MYILYCVLAALARIFNTTASSPPQPKIHATIKLQNLFFCTQLTPIVPNCPSSVLIPSCPLSSRPSHLLPVSFTI
jgi:hypothetical protein